MPKDIKRDLANPQSSRQGSTGSSLEQAKSSVQEDVANLKAEAGRQGAAALDSIKQGAQSLGEQAKEQVVGYAEGGKQAVTQHLDDFAGAIRTASDELSKHDQTMASHLVRQAAGGLEGLSRAVNGASIGDMVDSVRGFGRRNPAAFIGGSILLGLALGRFVRSSSPDSDDDWDSRRPGGNYGGARNRSDWNRGGNEGISPSPYSGSSYPAGQRASFAQPNRGSSDAPSPSQGYAGGGMRQDTGQSTSSPGSGKASSAGSASANSTAGKASQSGVVGSGSVSTGDKS